MLAQCILLGTLVVLTREDIRTRELPVWCLIISGVCGVGIFLLQRPLPIMSLVGGIAIGLLLLLYLAIAKGGIGAGDGYLFCVTGIFLGFRENMVLLMTALILAAGYAGVLLLRKRCERKTQLPFLPFVLTAYMLLLLR